jgi:GTPase
MVGGCSARDTPVPIPNTVVKPRSADGTAGEARWESTSPPTFARQDPLQDGSVLPQGVLRYFEAMEEVMNQVKRRENQESAGPVSQPSVEEVKTRCGFVAIVGRPNAGKSTLMNALLGEHLSIVTPRAQTTWVPVKGILTRATSQIIFVDTPGVLSNPSDLLQHALLEAVAQGVRDADAVLLLLDPLWKLSDREREVLRESVSAGGRPLVVAVNKVDEAPEGAVDREVAWAREALGVEPHRISATTGEGTEALVLDLERRIPAGPFLYPDDEVATAPVRFFVEELVRETVFEMLHDEMPWSVLPRVEAFREGGTGGEGRTYINVVLHVERASQKGILVGEGGRTIRKLGMDSRRKIEAFLGEPVFLELWVKVMPRWRRKKGELRRMGLPVPEGRHGSS